MKTKIKRRSLRITGYISLVLISSTILFYSCEKEEIKVNQTTKPEPVKSTFNCLANCIKIGGPYFEKPDQKIVNFGKDSKTVDIVYYNTETDFVVKIRSSHGWKDVYIDGVDAWTGREVEANQWGILTYPLDVNWEACDLESYELKVIGEGPAAVFMVDYNLIGICDSGCKSTFSGKSISCGTQMEAIYTLTVAETQDYIKIQGGLNNFIGEEAIVKINGANLTVSQGTPKGSKQRIIKLEGAVATCDEITIHVMWKASSTEGAITSPWTIVNESGTELVPEVKSLQCL